MFDHGHGILSKPALIFYYWPCTLYKYGHLSVLSDHAVELIHEESEQARSANDVQRTKSASIDTTAAQEMCLFVHQQSRLLSLFVGCPRSPVSRSAPQG